MTDEENKEVEPGVETDATAEPTTVEATTTAEEATPAGEVAVSEPSAEASASVEARTSADASAPTEVASEPDASSGDTTIESLMQEASGNPELENRAMAAAAEAAIKEGERALESAARAVAHVSGKIASPPPETEKKLTGKRLLVLRALLLFNVVMMGVMMVLPDAPVKSEPELVSVPPVVPAETESLGLPETESVLQQDPNRYISPLRHPSVTPDSDLMVKALQAFGRGEYDEAVELMKSYLAKYPEMNPQLRSLAYSQLVNYLRLSGRKDEALRLEIQLRHLRGSSNYPADLLKRAREARTAQNFHEMRRAYAKLLLTQNTIGPAMRAAVVEAYLRFGDSYRHEAGFSGQNATERDRLLHGEQLPSKADERAKNRAANTVIPGPSRTPPPAEKSGGH